MNKEGAKRMRTPNFSPYERSMLMKMANRRKHVLENKRTDAVTNVMKSSAWSEIEEELNSTCGGGGHFRDAKCLRSKYECIKKELRKQSSGNAWKQTGGGPFQPPPPLPNTQEEMELLQAMQLSMEGLPPIGDGDDGYQTGILLQEMSNVEVVNMEVDWEKSSALMIRTPTPPPLCVGNELSQGNSEILDPHQSCTAPPPSPQPLLQQQPPPPLQQKQQPSSQHQQQLQQEPEPEPEPDPVSLTKKSTGANRRRPVFSKKRYTSSASAKFEDLADKKTKLVLLKEEIKKKNYYIKRKDISR